MGKRYLHPVFIKLIGHISETEGMHLLESVFVLVPSEIMKDGFLSKQFKTCPSKEIGGSLQGMPV